ncbi:unnamed protein product [Nyctereutes procyonoides]|uniref:(raccoon dog) hypothetical protein n=1 Tax=Nyctereutes procyonoides TaxID=34880 RepID=A0A811YX86_NYCPR|nr:unnamed protein product [Nyctereutes procyonoides]
MAQGLQDMLQTNLGPKDIKLIKDASPKYDMVTSTGDDTSSNVLIIGELLKQANFYISENLHPRIITEGYEATKEKALQAVVDSILAFKKQDEPTDLFMFEIIEHGGLVLDHGAWCLDMKKKKESKMHTCLNAHAEERSMKDERKFIEDRGIDFFSLEAFAKKEGIVALCRAKRNMEKLSLACGGVALNSFVDLVYEYTLGEENCNNPHFVTLLVKGSDKHTLTQIKDTIRDGLMALKMLVMRAVARPILGVQAFADNSGFELQETLKFKQNIQNQPMVATTVSTWDNYSTKRQLLHSRTVIATNVLLVGEITQTGMSFLKG